MSYLLEYSVASIVINMQELRLCWTGDLEKLKLFVSKNVDFVGVWTSPGNDKKKYSDGYSSISWRKSKKVLEIEGRDRNLITAKLCTMLCNDFDPVHQAKATTIANSLPQAMKCLLNWRALNSM